MHAQDSRLDVAVVLADDGWIDLSSVGHVESYFV